MMCEEESLCGAGTPQTPCLLLTIHSALREQQVQRAGSAKHSSPCTGLSVFLVKEHLCSTTKSFGAGPGGGAEEGGAGNKGLSTKGPIPPDVSEAN